MVERSRAEEPEQTIAYRGRHLAGPAPGRHLATQPLAIRSSRHTTSRYTTCRHTTSRYTTSSHAGQARTVVRTGFGSRGILVPLSLLIVGLLISMTAFASAVTFTDEDGANDEPGQKDLTLLTVDNAGLPTSLAVTWNWDVTTISGSNTVDGCSLFDSDGDSLANFSVCEVWGDDPAPPSEVATVLYTCTDLRADRCTGPTEDTSITSSCTVAISGTDPFVSGDSYPNDVKATCTINLADVGPPTLCFSTFAPIPRSSPIRIPRIVFSCHATASSSLRKWRPRTTTRHFPLLWMAAALPVFTATGSETSAPIAVRSDINHSIAEAVPVGWDLDSASCTLEGGGSTGSLVGSTISDIDVVGGRRRLARSTKRPGRDLDRDQARDQRQRWYPPWPLLHARLGRRPTTRPTTSPGRAPARRSRWTPALHRDRDRSFRLHRELTRPTAPARSPSARPRPAPSPTTTRRRR